METLTFSKTRLAYYDNNASLVTKDVLEAISIDKSKTNRNYALGKIPKDKCNWHSLMFNRLGCYCTFAEVQMLFDRFDGFVPVKVEIDVGHSIPIVSMPTATGGTTQQLSFNNCIYSLITEVSASEIFLRDDMDYDKFLLFVRSFDGSSFGDNKAMVLPTVDVFFKIPHVVNTESEFKDISTVIHTGDADKQYWYKITAPNFSHTLKKKALHHAPEFLQNNENVFALYPGENQYNYVWNATDSSKVVNHISTSPQAFGELERDLDRRFQIAGNQMPVDYSHQDNSNLLNLNLFRITDHVDKDVTNLYELYVGNSTALRNHDHPAWILLKGVPILDNSGNLINHRFMSSINYTITFECKRRSHFTPRELQFSYPLYVNVNAYKAKEYPGQGGSVEVLTKAPVQLIDYGLPIKYMAPSNTNPPVKYIYDYKGEANNKNIPQQFKVRDTNDSNVDTNLKFTRTSHYKHNATGNVSTQDWETTLYTLRNRKIVKPSEIQCMSQMELSDDE